MSKPLSRSGVATTMVSRSESLPPTRVVDYSSFAGLKKKQRPAVYGFSDNGDDAGVGR